MLKVKVYPDLNSRHIAQVYSGLFDLAKAGKIHLEFTSRIDSRIKKSARNSVLCLQISDSEHGQERTVCFDMFDGCEISSVERLRLADVYVKRSYDDQYVRGLDAADSRKVIPYGLNYECRTRNERHILKRLVLFHLANHSLSRNPLSFVREFSREVLRYILLRCNIWSSSIYKPMSIDEFVVHPAEPTELGVLFQTRLWTPQECPRIDERRLKEINDMRVGTVRSLKKTLGRKFVGGLIPTDLARQHYADLCIPVNDANRRNYTNLVKRCLICVTTAGLHDSIGGKLAEYVAASRCIVTEPLRYQLPVPLKDGINYLSFRTPEECVDACDKLLGDPQLASQMRHENYNYYLNEVEPSVLVHKRLKAAMSL